jgi:hypothetical protein
MLKIHSKGKKHKAVVFQLDILNYKTYNRGFHLKVSILLLIFSNLGLHWSFSCMYNG